MLRSEPRLTPEVLEDLDRLDAAIHADRSAGSVASRAAHGGDPDGPQTGHHADDEAADDLDAELLALVAGVRATRPQLDVGTRMRLEERVQAAKEAPAPRATPRFAADRRWRLGLAAAAVVAIAIPVGAVLQGGSDSDDSAVVASQTSGSASAADSATGAAGAASSSATTGEGSATESSKSLDGTLRSGSTTLDGPDAATADPATTAPSPASPSTRQAPLDATRRVIRDVQQTVRVNPGDVAKSADRVTSIVQDAGGYLGSSEVRERGARAGGTFQVVVPTNRLDATVAALSRIGEPVRLERSSSDVTDQAVSLDDQLRDLRADRSAARLALAKTIDDDRRAARRRELDLLSSRIAALQGQRDELRRRTSTSRIDLRLTTTKAAEDEVAPVVDDGSWGIGDAWDDAGRVLEVGGGVLLVGGVIVLPLAALLALGLGLRRRADRRRRDGVIDQA